MGECAAVFSPPATGTPSCTFCDHCKPIRDPSSARRIICGKVSTSAGDTAAACSGVEGFGIPSVLPCNSCSAQRVASNCDCHFIPKSRRIVSVKKPEQAIIVATTASGPTGSIDWSTFAAEPVSHPRPSLTAQGRTAPLRNMGPCLG